MKTMKFLSLVKCELKKKFWVLVFFTLLFAGGVAAEKMYFSPVIAQSSNLHIERMIRVIDTEEKADKSDVGGYENILRSYAEMETFQKQSEKEFDYSKFDANWKNLSQERKLKWLQNHIAVGRYYKGCYQFLFTLDSTVPKDVPYSNREGPRMLESFVLYAEKRIQEISPQVKFAKVNQVDLLAKNIEISKYDIVKKYAIIGAFLGLIAGSAVIVVNVMRKLSDD